MLAMTSLLTARHCRWRRPAGLAAVTVDLSFAVAAVLSAIPADAVKRHAFDAAPAAPAMLVHGPAHDAAPDTGPLATAAAKTAVDSVGEARDASDKSSAARPA